MNLPLPLGKDRNKQMDFLKGLFPYSSGLYRNLSLLCFEQVCGLVQLSRYITLKEIMKIVRKLSQYPLQ